ncbi:membrane protein [Empedobacter brevis NBRC 14943 = ATCC 43319]|uniref:Membrane protein n=1 Tax=Empedobacter brevis NBRC 14943 = ATCC 43319 TaxID=1218108 RepID=A0A511NEA5_9FLAO|nr:DMT family transporter [Empedobacter brevis]GEM51150.1 membrane protein [Empedobacter brevis NBRC 14943 = ATCC 43319]
MKFKGYAYGLISSISYGLIPLFILPIKQANFSIDTTLFYRFFFSALIVGVYLFVKKQSFRVHSKQIPVLIVLGLLYGISADALFLGYDYLSAGIASTLLFVYPLIVAIIMVVFFKERITISTIAAIAFVLAGIFLLSFKDGQFKLNPIGLGIVFISALGYGLYIITVNKSSAREIKGFTLSFYSFLFTTIYYAIKMLIQKESFILPSLELTFNFFTFAFVTTVISSIALIFAIKNIGSTATSILGASEPVVAVAVSVIIFGENFSMSLALGIFMIIFGVTLNVVGDAYQQKRIKSS